MKSPTFLDFGLPAIVLRTELMLEKGLLITSYLFGKIKGGGTNFKQNYPKGVDVMDLVEDLAWMFLAIWVAVDISTETHVAAPL